MKNVFAVSTAINADATPITTMLTLDYAGVDIGDGTLLPDAEKSIVINLQSGWRRSKAIPKTLTVQVKDHLAKTRTRAAAPATKETAEAHFNALSPVEQRAMLKRMEATLAKPAKPAPKSAEAPIPPKGDGDTSKPAQP